MQKGLTTGVALVLAPLFLLSPSWPANAAPDDSAPVISNFQISRTSIDSASSSRSITFSFKSTDETGLRGITVHFCRNYAFDVDALEQGVVARNATSPAGNIAIGAQSVSGNAQDFTISVTVSINANTLPQTCNVSTFARDALGNQRANVPQGSYEITRSGTADDQGPVVSNFQISRTSIDSASSSRSITFSFGATDATGIRYVTVNFCNNYEFAFDVLEQGVVARNATGPTGSIPISAQTVTGNAQAFTVSATMSINANAAPQACNVSTYSNDMLGNRSGNVSQGSFQITRSGTADDQGPVVSNFQISRTSIDSASSSRSITFSFGATDATGIRYVTINFCNNYEFSVDVLEQGIVARNATGPTGSITIAAQTVSGNARAFTVSATMSINANAVPQTCNVSTYSNDILGNRSGNLLQGSFLVTRSQIASTPSPSPSASPRPSVSPSPSPSPSPSSSSSPGMPAEPTSQTYHASTLFTASSSKILPSTTKTITSLVKTSKNWSVATITTSFSNSKSAANQKAVKLEEQRVSSLKSLLIKSGLKASQIKVVKRGNSKATKPQTNLTLR